MSPRIYYPQDYVLVPASQPYPKNTFYKVSVGQQRVNERFHDVVKVEMVYEEKLGGARKINPAYPCGSDDFKKVIEAINKLL